MWDNTFVHPGKGIASRLLSSLANNRLIATLRRKLISRLPFLRLESDVTRVVYLNWLVPLDAVAPLVPAGLELTSHEGLTVLTVLTYSHGHFGPALAGPLRGWFPSPLQSNWRLYVARINGEKPHMPTVLFIRNVFDSALHCIATRLFSDALPSHLAKTFHHRESAEGPVTRIEGGAGSAPDLTSVTAHTEVRVVPPEFARFFSSWPQAVEALCLQDSAVCHVPALDRIAQAGIDLPIQVDEVTALTSVSYEPGVLLRSLGAVSAPFCFYVPRVRFRVLWERLL